ncbi:ATP-dependent RNA helicase DDX54 [Porphyridium purpureum]|uniref:ATP-dependent RNA helicase DDX54 n=1 Tax=Porphyridium purpureum TaxID=35688 RepID=A0A5J4YNN0_PORPP|nr:ATP-dependent RNA helicase DDX54 [Porphyridium purpureum]|eukprot:POR5120..scf222_8
MGFPTVDGVAGDDPVTQKYAVIKARGRAGTQAQRSGKGARAVHPPAADAQQHERSAEAELDLASGVGTHLESLLDLDTASESDAEPGLAKRAELPGASRPARTEKAVRQGSFEQLGLGPELCMALKKKGYRFPTPVQRKVIPLALAGDDVVVMARTGSGKTAAFLLPVLEQFRMGALSGGASGLNADAVAIHGPGPRVLVLSPTRELAMQTFRFVREYSKFMSTIRTTVIVGGEPLDAQFAALSSNPHIVIATPGRLLQVVSEMKSKYSLRQTRVAVFDEADRLFEGTLAQEAKEILALMGGGGNTAQLKRQTLLVSATMPKSLADFSRFGLRGGEDQKFVRLDVEKNLSPTLASAFYLTRSDERTAALLHLLRSMVSAENVRSVLIFVATKHRVDFLVQLLQSFPFLSDSAVLENSQVMKKKKPRSEKRKRFGTAADALDVDEHSSNLVVGVHGHMDQSGRTAAISAFRDGRARFMVVTDVAARGIDIPVLDAVINYDFPATPKLYVHRCGRAARAGRTGTTHCIVSSEDLPYVLDTFLFLGRKVFTFDRSTAASVPDWDGDINAASAFAWQMQTSFYLGRLPQAALEDEMESVQYKVQTRSELASQLKSAENAHRLYVKTRPQASGESARRAKDFIASLGSLETVPLHPWYLDACAGGAVKSSTNDVEPDPRGNERSAVDLIKPGMEIGDFALLSTWRPDGAGGPLPIASQIMRRQKDRRAVLLHGSRLDEEAGHEVMNAGAAPSAVALLQSRADEDEEIYPKTKRKKTSLRDLAKQSQRNSSFYLPLVPDEAADQVREDGLRIQSSQRGERTNTLRDQIVDMVGEDPEESKHLLKKRTNPMVWDSKRKRFVRQADLKRPTGGNRNNADQKNKPAGALFQAWRQKRKLTTGDVGSELRAQSKGDDFSGLGSRDFRKGSHGRHRALRMAKQTPGGGGSGTGPGKTKKDSELRDVAQIRKLRKDKSRKQAKSQGGKRKAARTGRPEMRPSKVGQGQAFTRSRALVKTRR